MGLVCSYYCCFSDYCRFVLSLYLLHVFPLSTPPFRDFSRLPISSKSTHSLSSPAICFPVIIILLIPFRHYIIPSFISPHDLAILDAPTANSDAVFVSLGGPLVDKEDVIEGRKDVESRSTAVEEERVGEEKDGVRLRKL